MPSRIGEPFPPDLLLNRMEDVARDGNDENPAAGFEALLGQDVAGRSGVIEQPYPNVSLWRRPPTGHAMLCND